MEQAMTSVRFLDSMRTRRFKSSVSPKCLHESFVGTERKELIWKGKYLATDLSLNFSGKSKEWSCAHVRYCGTLESKEGKWVDAESLNNHCTILMCWRNNVRAQPRSYNGQPSKPAQHWSSTYTSLNCLSCCASPLERVPPVRACLWAHMHTCARARGTPVDLVPRATQCEHMPAAPI